MPGDYINVYTPSGLTDGLGSNPGYIGASAPGQWWIVGTQSGEAGALTISAAPEPAAYYGIDRIALVNTT